MNVTYVNLRKHYVTQEYAVAHTQKIEEKGKEHLRAKVSQRRIKRWIVPQERCDFDAKDIRHRIKSVGEGRQLDTGQADGLTFIG